MLLQLIHVSMEQEPMFAVAAAAKCFLLYLGPNPILPHTQIDMVGVKMCILQEGAVLDVSSG